MKNIALLVALLLSYGSYGQKPTGGCGFKCSIVDISPCSSPYVLYNGSDYKVKVSVAATGCEPGYGDLEIKIGTTVLGKIHSEDIWFLEEEIMLDKFSFPAGGYQMVFNYHDQMDCRGTYSTQKVVIIKDTVITDTAKAVADTNTAHAVTVQEANAELLIYPVPTAGNLTISGLHASETSYELHMKDMQGQRVHVATQRNNTTISIPTIDLPVGFYFIELTTKERSLKKTVQVIR